MIWVTLTHSFCYVNTEHQICILNANEEYKLRFCLRGHHSPVLQLLFYTHSILLSCGTEGLFIWDLARDGACTHLYSFFVSHNAESPIRSLACASSPRILSWLVAQQAARSSCWIQSTSSAKSIDSTPSPSQSPVCTQFLYIHPTSFDSSLKICSSQQVEIR